MNENRTSAKRGVVVVGIDGSTGATAALRWAAAEARLRRTGLRLVHAWTFSYPMGVGYLGGAYLAGAPDAVPDVGLSNRRRAADELLKQAIGQLGAEADGLEIERAPIEGPTAETLVSAATRHDLLVVGSRGHGGFVGLLLGSVSQQCAHHASCPVVIVPPPDRSGADSNPARTEEPSAFAGASSHPEERGPR
jgi:nucleotide-binding universal stress UspA family protein